LRTHFQLASVALPLDPDLDALRAIHAAAISVEDGAAAAAWEQRRVSCKTPTPDVDGCTTTDVSPPRSMTPGAVDLGPDTTPPHGLDPCALQDTPTPADMIPVVSSIHLTDDSGAAMSQGLAMQASPSTPPGLVVARDFAGESGPGSCDALSIDEEYFGR
jgi:hypothetical protein